MAKAHMLGVPVDQRPEDLMLDCVRQAAGALRWATDKVAASEGEPSEKDVETHRMALREAARTAKMALDAGIAERKLRLAQATGALIAAAFEHALSEAGVEPKARQAIVARFEGRLLALEQGSEDVTEGSAA